jgi:hypothetical protein
MNKTKQGWHEKKKWVPERKKNLAVRHSEVRGGSKRTTDLPKDPDKLIKKYKLLSKKTEETRKEILKRRKEEREKLSAFDVALKEQNRIRQEATLMINHLDRLGFIHTGKQDIYEKSIYHVKLNEQRKGNETRFIHMGKGRYRVFYRPYEARVPVEKYEEPKRKKPKYRTESGKFVTQDEYYQRQPGGIPDLKIESTPKREKPKDVIVFKNSGDKEPTTIHGMTLDEYFDIKRPDKPKITEQKSVWKYEKGKRVKA